jgi:hypothetical protein
VTDLDEAPEQAVVEKPTDEFDGTDGGGVLAAGTKDDGLVVDADDARVADGDAVGVATEIAIHLLGAAERTLGVDDPALVVEPRAATARGAIVEVVREKPAGAQACEAVEELPSKQRAEDVNRQQEFRRRGDPGLAVGCEATAGDDAVGVGMKASAATVPGARKSRSTTRSIPTTGVSSKWCACRDTRAELSRSSTPPASG